MREKKTRQNKWQMNSEKFSLCNRQKLRPNKLPGIKFLKFISINFISMKQEHKAEI